MKRIEIESIPYGTSEQNDAADKWLARFIAFCERHESWCLHGNPSIWRKLLFKDVWYLAQQRRIYLWKSTQ